MESQLCICRTIKHIHDIIHDYIPLSAFAIRIIDNPIFQRLRFLKQLGTCSYVFPNATHTRFEHSIGTYHLAKQLLGVLTHHTNPSDITEYLSTIPELSHIPPPLTLNPYISELISIAALCHDIGHGPYSHLFDDAFMLRLKIQGTPFSTHEERSELLLESIITSDPILQTIVHKDDIAFMKTLINPKPHHVGFIYQIVSNTLNGLDVDKFDYLPRDIKMIKFQGRVDVSRLINDARIIDNNIAYPKQALSDIYNLYHTRHQLHRQIYCHKSVIAVQHLIVDILVQLDPILKISDTIGIPHLFCELTDDLIFEAPKVLRQLGGFDTTHIDHLIDRLISRNMYAYVASSLTESKPPIQYLLDEFQDSEQKLVIYQTKIGFVSGNKPNPLDNVITYNTKDTTRAALKLEIAERCKNDITVMMPQLYQEYLTIVYYKDRNDLDMINMIKNRFCREI